MNASLGGLGKVYIIAAFALFSIAISTRLSVPVEVADYVNNGLMLPIFRYGLLFALIAYGIVLSGEFRPGALVIHLGIFTFVLWFGLRWAEPIILPYEDLTQLIINYPVATTAMGIVIGIALLLPLPKRRWLVPFVSAICGFCLAVFILLESPFDFQYAWFTFSSGLGCLAVVVASIILTNGARRILSNSVIAIAERICGSWLIAASLLLGALAFFPQQPPDPASLSTTSPSPFDQILQEP
ncbi:MAG: hypothetical protein AAGC96_16010 [Pseudomonadota bacterium]